MTTVTTVCTLLRMGIIEWFESIVDRALEMQRDREIAYAKCLLHDSALEPESKVIAIDRTPDFVSTVPTGEASEEQYYVAAGGRG